MSEATITLDNRDEAVLLFGNRDAFLREVRDARGVRLIARGDAIHVRGTDQQVEQAERIIRQLRQMLHQQGQLSNEDVRTVIEVVTGGADKLSVQPDQL